MCGTVQESRTVAYQQCQFLLKRHTLKNPTGFNGGHVTFPSTHPNMTNFELRSLRGSEIHYPRKHSLTNLAPTNKLAAIW